MKIKFLGAAQQVTGSCYFLEAGELCILIDCGMYQERKYRKRNWAPFQIDPQKIDYIILTHSHLDHVGLIPKLVRDGFSGQILATSASIDLLKIVLMDSAKIQEEDAEYKKKRHKREGRKGPYPEVPLYTVQDAKASLLLFKAVSYDTLISLDHQVTVKFSDAGHILGSAMIEIEVSEKGISKKIIFSGDIGQWDKPLVRDPSVFSQSDYVVMESTYGDRNHEDPEDVDKLFSKVINDTVAKGGNIVIPTFAIERAQELMYHLSRLVRENAIPFIKIFLDSPMAVGVTDVFRRHKDCLDNETVKLFQVDESPFHFPGMNLVRTIDESKAINTIKEPVIVLAGSGMCTGGRIKHHLAQNVSRPESTLLFVGFQASGTLGRLIVNGMEKIRIHGKYYNFRAKVKQIHGFSAHADRKALLRWLGHFEAPPEKLFVTHGEVKSAFSLADAVKKKKGWNVSVPQYLDEFELIK